MGCTVALMVCGQKQWRLRRGASVLCESQTHKSIIRIVKQPREGVENPQNICLKQFAIYGGFGQHIAGFIQTT